MHLAAMLTSLPLEFEAALRTVRQLGFTHVDVVGLTERPASHLDALADSGLLVSCAAVGRFLPERAALDTADAAERVRAVEHTRLQIADAARLGATTCYVVSGHDSTPAALRHFADSCAALADFAAARMVRMCVEHVPGRALATAAATLEWLHRVQHDNLYLLLDVGHCLISEEDPAHTAVQAGDRLGYVHLDDNDSVSDLHWPLLTGRLTADMLEAVLLVLADFEGGVALELNPGNADPVGALREGKRLVEG
jgi:sugar phosphate isomerase/epimerase